MPKLTTTYFLTYGSVYKPSVPGIMYRSKKIHNSIKYTQSSSRVRWLNGELTNFSRTISVLVIRELNTFHICPRHEICALMGFYAVQNGNSIPIFRDNLRVPPLWSSSVRWMPEANSIQAKPIKAKQLRAQNWAMHKSMSVGLFSHSCINRITGLSNRHLHMIIIQGQIWLYASNFVIQSP